MTRIQKTVFILVALVALVIGLTVYKVLNTEQQLDTADLLDAGIVMLPQGRDVPDLTLTNQNGEPVSMKSLEGRWNLLFFGYTFCPDICPATLAELRQLRGQLPEAARQRMQPILVSVDPERDTPAQLKKYLEYFGAEFIGLTGSLDDIQTLANAAGVPFIPADTSKDNYTVDHGGNLALIGPDGRLRGFVRAPLRTEKLAEQLPAVLALE
ncbi:MAG: cytochrome c oxidase assembly protein [Pseudomonas sp.]|jgi:protein SCO1/2|uniref:SCO family protein n=1 Tax=Pseudomonadaceae TaxID=135621 RepID=UPI000C4A1871|nr:MULTISPECIES: SCO family protein [Pseudomonadaceae]MAX90059.1 cytochrome c oxidase assembly protein [Pseudomonas sp.]MBU0812985.1 SCO family protein [Gammaproteobacteria bacterium]MBK3849729.1 redoxin domain-containing protein [Stutzerimonas xanthomarina]MBU0851550.1 SCO family protein [Gammaproteobacteria bacterium]MBU1300443.1 SCO family protein [Gammaproteobacteria bacterium]|tara:strand:- start:3752 stop:4384 length:633 start_codon:yes stop_codon:yes gene_type:complete